MVLALVAMLAACATPQTDELLGAARTAHAAVQPRRMLGEVPFIAQDRDQCGPASLAMALRASGAAVGEEDVRPLVFVPGRHGSLAPELPAAARRMGRLAVLLEPRLDALVREVDGGNPVIVLQNLGLSVFPVWHFAVVVGYDLPHDLVFLHSGPSAASPMSLETFERTWSRADRWAMLVMAPGRLPVTPSTAVLVDAAAALERVDVAAAHGAYAAIVTRDPANFGAWIGLGNSAFAIGDRSQSVDAFAHATRLDPASADAWNNLASAQLAAGDLAGARDSIARALRIGGANREIYDRTAREVESASIVH